MGFSIGIDIGTANTRVAVFRNGRPEIIPDADGRHSMPSYVAFTERCRLFGSAAKAQATSHPENTVYGVKRILGQHLDQVQVSRYTRASSNHPQENNGQITISVGYKKRSHHLSPVQVFAMLVARARANAEAYLGEPVYNAAISVPAYFNNSQREDVRDAVLLGGVNLLYMGTSIESIALYHAFINRQEGERLTLFLDLGASFFNAGLALIEEGIIEMVSCASDNDLGTEDFVDRLHKHFAAEIQRKWGWDIKDDLRAKRRLRVACEVAMRDLSSIASTEVYIDSLYDGQDFSGTITRIRLEELCHDLFRSTFQPIQRVLADAKRDKSLVMDIVIVGGGSRIPKLQKMWSDYFGSKPLVKTVNPDEGEVLGSSIYADIFSGYVYSLRDLLVLPILPISIGFETRRGMFKIVPRNKTCPTTKIESHSLYELNFGPSDRPTLRFYQGERVRVKDNLLIGTLDLAELPLSWSEANVETMIEIKVDIDNHQRVMVTATVKGKSTSRAAWQRVLPRSKEVMESLLLQAESYQEDDATEEARAAERCAVDLRIASLGEFQPPDFQTRRMMTLLQSLDKFRSWVDENETVSLADYRACHQALDELDRGLKSEELRAGEITRIRSHAGELREKLLATTQTPKIWSLLQSVDALAQWVEKNEEAEIQEYQVKLRSLMSISVELITLSEVPPSRESTPSTGTPQPPRPDAATPSQSNAPRGFDQLFPESGWDAKSRYTDAEFEGIVSYLRNTDHQSWSKVPRIYTVLRLIDQVELVDAFLKYDMTDIWFPFSENTLPKVLKQPHRAKFLQAQEAVFSKALELERGSKLDDNKSYRRHAHFSHGEPLPFKVVAVLGTGAHGFVDKVVSTLSYREYARKRFKRSTINKKDVKTFLNEVKILKTLSHKHCIDMVGSYSDPRYFALIISPVAECNLDKYYSLALADRDKLSILQSFFGCLAGTLDFLHSQKVVHQDIKPQNILVKDNSHVLVADFGIARSWEGLTRATTTADLDRSWMYAAPEVARGGPKNESADVWSLGCVFLEMCTVLKGKAVAEMRAFLKSRSDSTSFHDNAAPGHITAWADSLRSQQPPEANRALEWVDSMLQIEPRYRCKPFELFDKTVAVSESTGILFCGACCRDPSESTHENSDEHLDRWSESDDDNM